MLTTRKNPVQAIRDAVALVRSNPTAVEAIDQEAAAEAARAKAEAKRNATLAEKVAAALPGRIEALVADYVAMEQEALRRAAESLAREQLERELGAIPLKVAVATWPPARLNQQRVENALKRILASAPLAHDKGGRSADRLRSDQMTEANAALARENAAAVTVDNVEERIAERRAKLEDQRQRRMVARKDELRAAGILPPGAA